MTRRRLVLTGEMGDGDVRKVAALARELRLDITYERLADTPFIREITAGEQTWWAESMREWAERFGVNDTEDLARLRISQVFESHVVRPNRRASWWLEATVFNLMLKRGIDFADVNLVSALGVRIDEVGLDVRRSQALARSYIWWAGMLAYLTLDDLRSVPQIGEGGIRVIKEALARKGLRLKGQ